MSLGSTVGPSAHTGVHFRAHLQTLSLERNALDESALLALAAALTGHPSLERLSLGHQRPPISRLAATALLDAMDRTPGASIHSGV